MPVPSVKVFSQPDGLRNNAYVLIQGKVALVIDPSFLVGEIEAFLSESGLRLTAILLTHAHFDHMGDGQAMARRHGISVQVSEKDRFLFVRGLLSKWRTFDPNDHVSFFEEAPITEGFAIKTIAAPGHSPGSVFYGIGDYLFCGDVVAENNVGPDNLPGGDPLAFTNTLRQLARMPEATVVMPGHYRTGVPLGVMLDQNLE